MCFSGVTRVSLEFLDGGQCVRASAVSQQVAGAAQERAVLNSEESMLHTALAVQVCFAKTDSLLEWAVGCLLSRPLELLSALRKRSQAQGRFASASQEAAPEFPATVLMTPPCPASSPVSASITDPCGSIQHLHGGFFIGTGSSFSFSSQFSV